METNEISIHEAKAYRVLVESSPAWLTHKELASKSEIALRTARAYTLKWKNLGIVEVAEVYPGHRYRLAVKADKRNAGYVQRLESVCEIFGLVKA